MGGLWITGDMLLKETKGPSVLFSALPGQFRSLGPPLPAGTSTRGLRTVGPSKHRLDLLNPVAKQPFRLADWPRAFLLGIGCDLLRSGHAHLYPTLRATLWSIAHKVRVDTAVKSAQRCELRVQSTQLGDCQAPR